jgi:hypothetical protein
MSGSGGVQATEKAGAALVKAIREGLPTPNRNAPHFAGRLGVQGGENGRGWHGQAVYGLPMRNGDR